MFRRLVFSAAAALTVMPALAWAQYTTETRVGSDNDVRYTIRTSPDHSATVAEGYLRGLGAAYEGYGAGARDFAQGQILSEQARGLSLQNDIARREAHNDLRQQYAVAQAAASARRRAQHQAQRSSRPIARRVNAPPVVSPEGRILWPAELAGDEFSCLRSALDAVVSQGSLLENNDALTQLGEQLCSEVAAAVKHDRLRPRALIAARQLVKGLGQVVDANGVRFFSAQSN